ncbi:MAG: site-specific integrase [Selenomonadaceae bacterium]|nr:site-specific integrase [Selenomonadaceae bacterium]
MAVAKNEKTGKWYAKFRYHDYTGRTIQKKKEGFDKRSDALKWEKDFIVQHEGVERLTFGQTYEKYLIDCEPRLKATTLIKKRRYIKHFKPLWEMAITEIKPRTIRQWQNDYLLAINPDTQKMIFTRSTIFDINGELINFFNWCAKFCGLIRNPAKDAGTITYRSITEKPPQVKNIWQPEHFEKFISYIGRPDHRLFYSLLFWCGLRRGEALGLRIKDIDLNNKLLKIRQNRTPAGIDTPKTKSSIRDVTIPSPLIKEINEYIKKLYQPAPNTLLFENLTVNISVEFYRRQQALNFKPRLRLHDLRHSHASMLINAGFSPDVVADRLGHANAQMVLKVYGHMYPEKRVEVTDALNKIYERKRRT